MKLNEFKINNSLIALYGNTSIITREKEILENLNLTGNEKEDRLAIQNCIDNNNLKSGILYNGNTVYPFNKIIKEYKKLEKSGSLEKLNKEMYHFFIYACGDIAHYDISGFKNYYNNSFKELKSELLSNNIYVGRFSDRERIFKELKIGSYYDEYEGGMIL